MSDRAGILILGGGPCGLGAAWALDRSGFADWRLCEADDHFGGLSASFRDDHGFTWDIGGHVVFSHYDRFSRMMLDLLGADGYLQHQRESWIALADTAGESPPQPPPTPAPAIHWVPYPFQYNLHRLPPAQAAECLVGLIRVAGAPPGPPPANFGEFIDRTFGEGIARLFMRPYNFKVWAYRPEQLSTGWVGQRVAVPDVARVARNTILRTDDVSWGPNNRFGFPRRGGTGAIWSALGSTLPREKVHLNCRAVAVDVDKRCVTFADGGHLRYDTLISTMPLDVLAQLAGRPAWIESTRRLKKSSVYVIGVGLSGRATPAAGEKCWMYFPDAAVPFYRVTHFSHYSPENVDDIARHWSLMAEVSCSPEKPVDESSLAQRTLAGLAAVGLIESPAQVTHTVVRQAVYGYPTPALERDEVLGTLLPELAACGVLSRGRFGAWRYEVGNMDHTFMQGVEAAEYLTAGTPEVTAFHPEQVNR